jgi:ubiquinone/menaquinone biosynthesis C-methylase UbiE
MHGVTATGTGRIDSRSVPRAFDEHAASYDRLVDANPGYHEHLRLTVARMGLPAGGRGLRLLDVGCGTGASTAALLAVAPEAEIVAVDASAEMLSTARRKSWPDRVRFVHGNAQNLAAAGVTGPFDGILAAYLVRNLPSPDPALRSFLALLRPGAPIAVHDYSVRDSVRSRVVWTLVCWTIIIPMGRLRTGHSGLYRYLWRSVLAFDGVGALTQRLRDAGFVDVRCQTFDGWQQNIVHTVLGRRRPEPETAPPSPAVAEPGTPSTGLPA